MRQSDIDTLLKNVCPDQIPAFRRFAATGDKDAAASIHFEGCLTCERALDALMELREDAQDPPPPRAAQGNRPWVIATAFAVAALFMGGVVFVGYTFRDFLAGREEALTELERTESRLRYVRMPGHPETCVAMLPGDRAYAPTFVGAAHCSRVHDRVEFDEEASYRLAQYGVVRIDGTLECLAHGTDDDSFTFPCAIDDD